MNLTADSLNESMQLDRFFDETKMVYDLVGGVIWNPGKTRVIILSTDLLTGVYTALVDEAGGAWKLILKNCGTIWGERVARRLDRECVLLLESKLGDMPLGDYLAFMTNYFAHHGWGTLTIDVSHAQQSGIVEATLRDSIWAGIVRDPEAMADPMISGILASMLSHLSGRPLGCVQTACVTKGSDVSRFIITAEDRLKDVETRIASGDTHEAIVATI
jgi:predicted hydrocarbon binding protein